MQCSPSPNGFLGMPFSHAARAQTMMRFIARTRAVRREQDSRRSHGFKPVDQAGR
jgi:hypothetical protein